MEVDTTESEPEPEISPAQALINVASICGPIKIIYRGDTATCQRQTYREQRKAVIAWLKETAVWIVTPPRW